MLPRTVSSPAPVLIAALEMQGLLGAGQLPCIALLSAAQLRLAHSRMLLPSLHGTPWSDSRLTALHLSQQQGYPGKFYCPRMATMNKPAYAAIQSHSPIKPVRCWQQEKGLKLLLLHVPHKNGTRGQLCPPRL